MKKIICAIFLLISFTYINSCKEGKITVEDRLAAKLTEIENTVQNYKLSQEALYDPFEDINVEFILSLHEINNKVDFEFFYESIDSIISKVNQNVLKSGLVLSYDGERTLTITEELIFKSYINTSKSNLLNDKIEIAEYYIGELQKMNSFPKESIDYCLLTISLHKNLMIHFNIDENIENKSAKLNSNLAWTPCASRGCFDCCMFRKSQAMDDWNWVEWAFFLAKPHIEVARMAGSCGWDCI